MSFDKPSFYKPRRLTPDEVARMTPNEVEAHTSRELGKLNASFDQWDRDFNLDWASQCALMLRVTLYGTAGLLALSCGVTYPTSALLCYMALYSAVCFVATRWLLYSQFRDCIKDAADAQRELDLRERKAFLGVE